MCALNAIFKNTLAMDVKIVRESLHLFSYGSVLKKHGHDGSSGPEDPTCGASPPPLWLCLGRTRQTNRRADRPSLSKPEN